jgi:hypothetical protein
MDAKVRIFEIRAGGSGGKNIMRIVTSRIPEFA